MGSTWIQYGRLHLFNSRVRRLDTFSGNGGRLLLVVAFALFFNVIPSGVFAQSNYWQQAVNYDISVKLIDSTKSLEGNIRVSYINHSPDTLHFIWFHLWPNAYKNDRTAFSEQLLTQGKTDFYFSDAKDRGYINKLDFRIDGTAVQTEDHPQFIDAVKLLLPGPLLPGDSVAISTPFYVKLPKEFSRSGFNGRGYAITQWYPKPAVYDSKGWHVMPYLEYGEYYAEFGNYNVNIQVPEDFVVASTGLLQDEIELNKLKAWKTNNNPRFQLQGPEIRMKSGKLKPTEKINPNVAHAEVVYKTLHYTQDSIHDFAWFASRHFTVAHKAVQLLSGRSVDVFCFYYPDWVERWPGVLDYAADAIKFRSEQLFEYPYPAVSVVQGMKESVQGMEYPMITYVDCGVGGETLDFLVGHEIGHNWFQGMIASNERDNPWMDEGLNSFIDRRYMQKKYGKPSIGIDVFELLPGLEKKLPADPERWLMHAMQSLHADQPIGTASEKLTSINYGLVPYLKTAEWLEDLEKQIGSTKFQEAFDNYLSSWKFRHPQPSDFKAAFKNVSNQQVDSLFQALSVVPKYKNPSRTIKPAFGFNLHNYREVQYINWLPVPGYNRYDKFMIGIGIYNYNLPVSKFQFLFIPMYATGSKQFNYLFHSDFTKPLTGWDERLVFSIDLQSFSRNLALDSLGSKVYERYQKVAPSVRYQFHSSPNSSVQRYLRFKTFLITESEFSNFGYHADDSLMAHPFVRETHSNNRYLNELSLTIAHNRKLYPNDWVFQVQQGKGFVRANATGNYFFNYKKYGGLSIRLFASKFGYLGNGSKNDPLLARYQPKLMGVTGDEDFTYSNYFAARTASYASAAGDIPNQGFAAQQIMIRDGGFKMRLDYFDFLQGKSDDWVSSINISTNLPSGILPVNLPIKLFLDFGTASGNWKSSYEGSRFMYVGGIQLSLLKSLVNVYAPLVYSKDIKDNLSSVPELNTFGKRLTFSFDIQRMQFRRLFGNTIPF